MIGINDVRLCRPTSSPRHHSRYEPARTRLSEMVTCPPGEPGESAGHRTRSHNADVIIEGWGPSLAACLQATAEGFVETFATDLDGRASRPVGFALESGSGDELLVALLEEILSVVEVFGVVPANIRVEPTENGGVAGFFDVVPAGDVELVAPIPKGVSPKDSAVTHSRAGWTCRATIKV